MSTFSKKLTVAAGALVAGTVAANAALLDFTDDATPLSGSFAGTSYQVTGDPQAPNRRQNFDGDADLVSSLLALDNDGMGIIDDEVSYIDPDTEVLTVRFDKRVRLTGLHFLDLFKAPGGGSEEIALVEVDEAAVPLAFGAFQTKTGDNPGYVFASTDVIGRIFTFQVNPTNELVRQPRLRPGRA